MPTETARSRDRRSLAQFSVFLENKVGRLNELLAQFSQRSVHIMALCTVDNTDSAITRFVVDYPEEARDILHQHHFSFTEVTVVGVQITDPSEIAKVTRALSAAEINIHYTYPFLTRPSNHCALIFHLEDNELGMDVLNQSGLHVLGADDIAR